MSKHLFMLGVLQLVGLCSCSAMDTFHKYPWIKNIPPVYFDASNPHKQYPIALHGTKKPVHNNRKVTAHQTPISSSTRGLK